MSALSIKIGRGASRLPADLALSQIPSLPRPVLERLAQSIIDHLDDMDGDNDVEPNGDELDGNTSEDDFMDHGGAWAQEGATLPQGATHSSASDAPDLRATGETQPERPA